MKNHMIFKLLAVLLATMCTIGLVCGGICVSVNLNYGLYDQTLQNCLNNGELYGHVYEYGRYVARQAARDMTGMPQDLWALVSGMGDWEDYWGPECDYSIEISCAGELFTLDTTQEGASYIRQEELQGDMPHILSWEPMPADWQRGDPLPQEPTSPQETTLPMSTEETVFGAGVTAPTTETTAPGLEATEPTLPVEWETEPGYYEEYYRYNGVYYRVLQGWENAEYRVTLYYTQEQVSQAIDAYRSVDVEFLSLVYHNRFHMLKVLAASLVGLALSMLYLAASAGRKPGSEEVRPRGLSNMPLDLYALVCLGLGFGGCYLLVWEALDTITSWDGQQGTFWMLQGICGALTGGLGLICILYWIALCAQVKKGNGYWWKNSLTGRVIWGTWTGVGGVVSRTRSRIVGDWNEKEEKRKAQSDRAPGPSLAQRAQEFFQLMPLMWQWVALGFGGILVLSFLSGLGRGLGRLLFWAFAAFCLVAMAYAAKAFGKLRDSARRMSQGQLDIKINTDTMADGCFRDFAKDLNAVSEACIVAAREQMKSERMKSELITNVSHDIKTPLTSIINYVDLLKRAQNEQERAEYLEVLDRQSLRLKKLIEDLMEMSKASSGNVAMELSDTDMVEVIRQALGEFADRLDGRKLNVLFRKSEDPMMAVCDGKLMWRVMSNVMTNVVKYAMPGTRVYIDLNRTEDRVTLELKNISAEELNISAEELMERFVRGDRSRNTEGNGLGLNIAKSLMEVQGGTLAITVDGDLFKVTITLRASRVTSEPEVGEKLQEVVNRMRQAWEPVAEELVGEAVEPGQDADGE